MNSLEKYEKLIHDFFIEIKDFPEEWVSHAASPFEKLSRMESGVTVVLVTLRDTGIRAIALWDNLYPAEFESIVDSIKAFPFTLDESPVSHFAFFNEREVLGLLPITEETAFISLSRLSPHLYFGQKPF
jgi:hypothetical protein